MTPFTVLTSPAPSVTPPARPERIYVTVDSSTTGPFDGFDLDQSAFWLPIIGPTCTVLVSLLLRSSGWWDVTELAGRVGVKPSNCWQSLDRLDRFRCGSFTSTDVFVLRRYLPALRPHQIERLPESMREIAALRSEPWS